MIAIDGIDFISYYFRKFKQKENMVSKPGNSITYP
jgi:hypothetical protein